MANSGMCLRSIDVRGSTKAKIICSDCSREFHAKYVNMSPDDIQCYTDNNLLWRCEPC